MTEKVLGKIVSADYGMFPDRPFLFGLILEFKMLNRSVCCGGKYTVNISKDCRWDESEREKAITGSIEFIAKILNDAKVLYVSELVGKPVEITLENRTFNGFRILTEVI